MSGRGLQRAAVVAEAAEAAGLNSASPAALQCLTPSSPDCSGDWLGGGRQPLLHAGFGGGMEKRPRLAAPAPVCGDAARYKDPQRGRTRWWGRVGEGPNPNI